MAEEMKDSKNEETMQQDECAAQLAACEKERDTWKEKYLYARADYDNAQRRMLKDMERRIWEGQAKTLRGLIEVVDNFERALHNHETSHEGLELIYKEMLKVLDQAGVKEIAEHDAFDPEIHEAVVRVDAPDRETGSIVEILQKGYRFHGEVLRPARVSVAQ